MESGEFELDVFGVGGHHVNRFVELQDLLKERRGAGIDEGAGKDTVVGKFVGGTLDGIVNCGSSWYAEDRLGDYKGLERDVRFSRRRQLFDYPGAQLVGERLRGVFGFFLEASGDYPVEVSHVPDVVCRCNVRGKHCEQAGVYKDSSDYFGARIFYALQPDSVRGEILVENYDQGDIKLFMDMRIFRDGLRAPQLAEELRKLRYSHYDEYIHERYGS